MDEKKLLIQQAVRQDYDGALEAVREPILNEHTIAVINESRKKAAPLLTYKDQPVQLDQTRPIGTGGSKEVYSVQIGDQHYALAIPAAGIDAPPVILKKWQAVLKEPENTDRIRKLGLRTNDLCQLVPIKINGTGFPALAMRQFQDLSYEIRDTKNPTSSVGKTRVLPEERPVESLEPTFDQIVLEMEILIKNNVQLSRDSFNLAVSEGKAHLYFNDLGTAKFENIRPENLERFVGGYIHFALAAFLNGITEAEYNSIQGKFEYDALHQKLKQKLLAKLDVA